MWPIVGLLRNGEPNAASVIYGVDYPNETETVMWIEDEETIQTWVNGREVILKKVGRDYAFRLANEAGNWMDGLPDGMVWADAQALFGDSL